MSENIEKSALLEYVPFTSRWKQERLSDKSPSYKTALNVLKNLNTSIESSINVQKQHLKLIDQYSSKLDLQGFARHVDAFLSEQAKIIYIATNKELNDKFNKLLESVEKDLYGTPEPLNYDVNDFVMTIDELTSMPSSIQNPPNINWKLPAEAILAQRNKKKAEQINLFLKEGGPIGDWFGGRYYGELQRGKQLKTAIVQIKNVVKGLYERNKTQYKLLKTSINKGDPDEYMNYLKGLASATASSTANVLVMWNKYFEKYIPEVIKDEETYDVSSGKHPDTTLETENVETPQPEEVKPESVAVENVEPVEPETSEAPTRFQFDPDYFKKSKPKGKSLFDPISPEQLDRGVKVPNPEKKSKPEPIDLSELEKDIEEFEKAGNQKDFKMKLTAEEILENIYKAADHGDPFAVASFILALAENAEQNEDFVLVENLTEIAEEAFDE